LRIIKTYGWAVNIVNGQLFLNCEFQPLGKVAVGVEY
jgi:hypothetical protein